MSDFINEQTVMQYYVERIDADCITFLKGRERYKSQVRNSVIALMKASTMNEKIQVAVNLWKQLFEASMSYISPDKRGYDNIFKFFDSYVEFEELIFASDSFYRDHTLHCIWVYFLGEYIANKEEFEPLFVEMKFTPVMLDLFHTLFPNNDKYVIFSRSFHRYMEKEEAVRCVSALTHDLGYPLKKIEKINKSIKKVLPYFAVNNFDDFTFEFSNTQQAFTDNFIDFISRTAGIYLKNAKENISLEEIKKANEVLQKIYLTDDFGNCIGIKKDVAKELTADEIDYVRNVTEIVTEFKSDLGSKNAFLNDFENYQHGIMSAFLLMKNLPVFQEINYDAKKDKLDFSEHANVPADVVMALNGILESIAAHTCDNYLIRNVDSLSYLTIVDELEEFSRISRASQNREYVKEFCESAIHYTKDGWLDIKFVFNNTNLDNLDPERAFKGRCKRFLSLFAIPTMSPNLKIRVTIKGELPNNQNEYVLEIAQKHAVITINGEAVNIPQYLKSTQFYTTEEYAQL